MMNKNETMLNWLQNEVKKDNTEIEKEKNDFINHIKKVKKNTIVGNEIKKLTLWQRIKKVLMGT